MTMMMAAMPDVSPLLLQEYEQHFAGLDSWVRGAARWDVGTVLLGSDVVPEAEFIRSEFFNDWCRRVGVRHLIGVAIPVGSEATAIVGMHRPADIEDFSQHERDLLGHLKPHFVRALALRRRLTGSPLANRPRNSGWSKSVARFWWLMVTVLFYRLAQPLKRCYAQAMLCSCGGDSWQPGTVRQAVGSRS